MKSSTSLQISLTPKRSWSSDLIGQAASIYALSLLLISNTQAQSAPQTRGFLITKFTHALYYDVDFNKVCPEGWMPDIKEGFLATLSPAERARLENPENADELGRRFRNEFLDGEAGEDICANPDAFVNDPRHAPSNHTSRSRIAYGLNLDGTSDGHATGKSCSHQKFSGPEGETGIDNQVFRAIGCSRMWRGLSAEQKGGDQVQLDQFYMQFGSYNYVLEISGITDMRNDDVEVGIYSTEGKPILDASAKFLPNQTLNISSNPRWTNRAKGRIVNGVLTTEAIELLRLNHSYPVSNGNGMGLTHEREFYGARLRLTFMVDGGLGGIMGAYQSPFEVLAQGRFGGRPEASVLLSSCAVEYNTMAALADGYPDPQTGKCTKISLAYEVQAIPAYLIHPKAVNDSDPVKARN
jgi:hypothetical protein